MNNKIKERVSIKKTKLDKLKTISDYNYQCKEYQQMANDPVAFIEKYGICHIPSKGYVPFKLHDHQKELLRAYHANDRNIVHHARQTGITLINALYAFHQAFFNREHTVVLTSNNTITAVTHRLFKRGNKQKNLTAMSQWKSHNLRVLIS